MNTKKGGREATGRTRRLPVHLQGYQVSLPQSLMPQTAPHQDDDLSASAQQLQSLSLQTSSATPDGQLQFALRHPSSYLPAVNEVNQWNLASQAMAPLGVATEVGRPPSPASSETSSQGYEATGFSNEPSPPASPAITQANLSFKMEETTQAIQSIQSAVFPASIPRAALLPQVVTPGTSSLGQSQSGILTRSLFFNYPIWSEH